MNDVIKDIRPPGSYPPEYGLWYALALFIVVSLIVLGIGWLIKRNRQRTTNQPQVKKAPWEVALEALAQFDQAQLAIKGETKEFYFRLTAIIRHYIEDRFHVNAPEMTTDEFLEYMKTSSALNGKQKDFLKQFLTVSDMIKFAKANASVEEMNQAFGLAKQFVQETIPAYETVTQTKVS